MKMFLRCFILLMALGFCSRHYGAGQIKSKVPNSLQVANTLLLKALKNQEQNQIKRLTTAEGFKWLRYVGGRKGWAEKWKRMASTAVIRNINLGKQGTALIYITSDTDTAAELMWRKVRQRWLLYQVIYVVA